MCRIGEKVVGSALEPLLGVPICWEQPVFGASAICGERGLGGREICVPRYGGSFVV